MNILQENKSAAFRHDNPNILSDLSTWISQIKDDFKIYGTLQQKYKENRPKTSATNTKNTKGKSQVQNSSQKYFQNSHFKALTTLKKSQEKTKIPKPKTPPQSATVLESIEEIPPSQQNLQFSPTKASNILCLDTKAQEISQSSSQPGSQTTRSKTSTNGRNSKGEARLENFVGKCYQNVLSEISGWVRRIEKDFEEHKSVKIKNQNDRPKSSNSQVKTKNKLQPYNLTLKFYQNLDLKKPVRRRNNEQEIKAKTPSPRINKQTISFQPSVGKDCLNKEAPNIKKLSLKESIAQACKKDEIKTKINSQKSAQSKLQPDYKKLGKENRQDNTIQASKKKASMSKDTQNSQISSSKVPPRKASLKEEINSRILSLKKQHQINLKTIPKFKDSQNEEETKEQNPPSSTPTSLSYPQKEVYRSPLGVPVSSAISIGAKEEVNLYKQLQKKPNSIQCKLTKKPVKSQEVEEEETKEPNSNSEIPSSSRLSKKDVAKNLLAQYKNPIIKKEVVSYTFLQKKRQEAKNVKSKRTKNSLEEDEEVKEHNSSPSLKQPSSYKSSYKSLTSNKAAKNVLTEKLTNSKIVYYESLEEGIELYNNWQSNEIINPQISINLRVSLREEEEEKKEENIFENHDQGGIIPKFLMCNEAIKKSPEKQFNLKQKFHNIRPKVFDYLNKEFKAPRLTALLNTPTSSSMNQNNREILKQDNSSVLKERVQNILKKERKEQVEDKTKIYMNPVQKEKKGNKILESTFKKYGEVSNASCPICYESLLLKPVLRFKTCTDVFHIECLEEYFVGEIDGRKFPIGCPNSECRKEISVNDIKNSLRRKTQYKQFYDDYSFKFFVDSHPDQYLYCPAPDCDYAFCKNDKVVRFDCPKCKKICCLKCLGEWHDAIDCELFAAFSKSQSDDIFLTYAEQMKYKQCPKCKHVIEKTEGCNHMQCSRCQTQFCYGCGKTRNGECKCG